MFDLPDDPRLAAIYRCAFREIHYEHAHGHDAGLVDGCEWCQAEYKAVSDWCRRAASQANAEASVLEANRRITAFFEEQTRDGTTAAVLTPEKVAEIAARAGFARAPRTVTVHYYREAP